MSERTNLEALLNPPSNGTIRVAKRRTAVKTTQEPTARVRRASASLRRRLALTVGGVGVSVLALSLWHCTSALAVLTGSPIFLAALLAIGIDAGLVVSELAHIAADGAASRWASRYVVLSIILSIGLNAFASAQHAERWPILAAIVGGTIPVLVYLLARVAGHLWRD